MKKMLVVLDKILITVELQRKTKDSWITVKTWKKSKENTNMNILLQSHGLTQRGKYRIRLTAKLFENNSIEKISVNSTIRSY